MKKPRPLQIKEPTPVEDRPVWGRVGVVGGVGLAIGLLWPRLTGMHLAPDVPGAERQAASAAAEEPAGPSGTPSGTPGLVVSAKAGPSASANAPASDANQQLVVVGEGTIEKCWQGKDVSDGAECGPLRVDHILAPRLKQLSSCPSALGMSAELQIGFDLDFEKPEVKVIRGKKGDAPKKGDVPSSTVQGVLSCIADSVRDISLQEIKHNHSKYRVYYTLKFYPPGARPSAEPAAEQPAEQGSSGSDEAAEAKGTAAVTWETALVRDEPRTGKVVARLVKGTRVTLLSKRQDWYRVRVRAGEEGWLYRGSLGL
jgi:hypothetical protein